MKGCPEFDHAAAGGYGLTQDKPENISPRPTASKLRLDVHFLDYGISPYAAHGLNE